MSELDDRQIVKALNSIDSSILYASNAVPDLRDQFAAAAITGILAGKWGQMPQYKPEEAFADFAYRIADEMIKRRNKHVDDETK